MSKPSRAKHCHVCLGRKLLHLEQNVQAHLILPSSLCSASASVADNARVILMQFISDTDCGGNATSLDEAKAGGQDQGNWHYWPAPPHIQEDSGQVPLHMTKSFAAHCCVIHRLHMKSQRNLVCLISKIWYLLAGLSTQTGKPCSSRVC